MPEHWQECLCRRPCRQQQQQRCCCVLPLPLLRTGVEYAPTAAPAVPPPRAWANAPASISACCLAAASMYWGLVNRASVAATLSNCVTFCTASASARSRRSLDLCFLVSRVSASASPSASLSSAASPPLLRLSANHRSALAFDLALFLRKETLTAPLLLILNIVHLPLRVCASCSLTCGTT